MQKQVRAAIARSKHQSQDPQKKKDDDCKRTEQQEEALRTWDLRLQAEKQVTAPPATHSPRHQQPSMHQSRRPQSSMHHSNDLPRLHHLSLSSLTQEAHRPLRTGGLSH